MNMNTLVQKIPETQTQLPHILVEYLDGTKLNDRVGEAICVTTVDSAGWPHTSLLSVGEILAIDPGHIRLATWKHSGTAANIAKTGRVSLVLARDHVLWEVFATTTRLTDTHDDQELALFSAAIVKVRAHWVDYAEVLTGVTYRLLDRVDIVKRWTSQITALRAFE